MQNMKFGRYEIISKLGSGGMASVYKAYDPHFDREVALKIMPRALLHDPTFRKRFQREARTVARLEHTSIVPVFDFGETNRQPYMVMQLMSGGSLADRMSEGPISISEAANIFNRIADGLDEAHAKGIIHRDLKPANILFDAYDQAYLADFGIVKVQEATAALTGSSILGTPAYISPEQVHGEVTIDGRSDIYALGTILFEMLTGRLPYTADTPVGIIVKHVNEPVPNILQVRRDLPPGIAPIIRKAMAKNRDERYRSVRAMADDLIDLAQKQPTRPQRVPRQQKSQDRPSRPTPPPPPAKGDKPANNQNMQIVAIFSILAGLTSLCVSWLWYCGPVFAILGIVLGIVSMKTHRPLAIIGIAASVLSLSISVIVVIITFVGISLG